PSGDQDTERIPAVCPLRRNSSRPSAASHTFAVPSLLTDASRLPSGDQDTDSPCPLRVSISWPSAVCHTFTVPLVLPVARNFPSGDQDTDHTSARWPIRVCSSRWHWRCQ